MRLTSGNHRNLLDSPSLQEMPLPVASFERELATRAYQRERYLPTESDPEVTEPASMNVQCMNLGDQSTRTERIPPGVRAMSERPIEPGSHPHVHVRVTRTHVVRRNDERVTRMRLCIYIYVYIHIWYVY